MTTTGTRYFTIYLRRDAYNAAQRFATQQDTVEKGKQVYLNTLAVYAVHDYLQLLDIETNLEQGNSWNPVARSFRDVSDLVLPGRGRLDCRPVLPQDTAFTLPDEIDENQIGYVAVQFKEQLDAVKLIGFAPSIDAANLLERVQVDDLQPLENLIDCIYSLEPDYSEVVVNEINESLSVEYFRQWLEGNYGLGWQSPQEVLSLYRNRSSEDRHSGAISRALLINLAGHNVALVVSVMSETGANVEIRFRLYPTGGEKSMLPVGIRLSLLDEEGECFGWKQAEQPEEFIQIKLLEAEPGDRISIKVSLGKASEIKHFEI